MGKLNKRVLQIVFIVILSVVLSGCGSNKNTNAPGDNSTGGTNQQGSGNETGNSGEIVDITIMGQFPQANLSETDKLLFQAIGEKTNTNIKFDIPPSTGYAERLQLMLSTGEYPDLVYFSSPTNAAFLNAVKDGAIIPVNEYIEKAEHVMKYTYDVSWDALKVNNDDNIYGLPRTSVIRSDGYWVRKDWLDHVGITIPEDNQITIEEMKEILYKFSKEDPDGNGIHDTYGLAHYAAGDKSLNPVFSNELGYYGWQDSSDSEYDYMSPKYDLNDDAFLKGLEFSAELYKEGLMDPDAPLIDSTTSLERFFSGRTGVLHGFAGHYEDFIRQGKEINPNFELEYVFVKNAEGEQKGLGQGTGLYGFWAITTEAANPQRIVDVFDYMLSDEGWDMVYHGIEGHDYTEENGERIYATPKPESIVRKQVVRRAEDYMFFIDPNMPEELQQNLVPLIQTAVERMILSKDRDYVPNVARTPEYLDFDKKFAEARTRIIVGDASVEEYTKVLQEWHEKFGQEYLTQMNDYIKQMEQK